MAFVLIASCGPAGEAMFRDAIELFKGMRKPRRGSREKFCL